MAGKSKTYELALKIAGKVDSSLKKSCQDADKYLSELGETAEKAGKIAATAFTAAATAAATLATASVKAYAEFETAANHLAAATGATGEEMVALNDAMETVYANNYGEDMQDVADTVALVNRNLKDIPTEQIDEAAQAAISLRDAFGYGVEESTRAAAAIEKNFGTAAEDAFSLIAAGAQNGLDYSGELIDTINEYSSQFSKLGFTADGMFNLLQSGADSTAWNLDKVGDAIKEFSIRSIDGSDSTREAFQALGYNAGEMMGVFAAGGDAANEAFFDVLDTLMDVDNEVKRDAMGVALFGTMWEDLGTEAMQAMADASQAAYDTQGALEQINAVQYGGLEASLEGVRRQAEMALVEIGGQLAPYAQEAMAYLGDVVIPAASDALAEMLPHVIEAAKWVWENREAIVKIGGAVLGVVAAYKVAKTALTAYHAISELHKAYTIAMAGRHLPALIAAKVKDKAETMYLYALEAKDVLLKAKSTAAVAAHTIAVKAGTVATKAAAVATKAMGAAMSFLTSPIGIAIMAITALIAAGVWLYKNWDTVKAKAAQLGAKISEIWGNIKAWVSNALSGLAMAFQNTFPVLSAYLTGWWQSISAAIENVKAIFQNIIDFVQNVFSGNWSAAWQNIVNIFGNVFGMIVNLAKAPINGVISAINWVLSKINSISVTIPDWVPGVGGQTLGFNIPTIPMLAAGGVATAPTLAMVGEGGEPEAIMPLSKLAALLDEWTKPKPGGGGAGQGGGTETITFAPVFNFYGPTTREDAVEAGRVSFAEFKRLYKQMKAEEARKSFTPA